jgi:hypothetical protein
LTDDPLHVLFIDGFENDPERYEQKNSQDSDDGYYLTVYRGTEFMKLFFEGVSE